jgi:hypothetical protein
MVLADYSNRALTFEGDKLLAIKGLIQFFSEWIGSKCIYGLWECDLTYGLLWGPGSKWQRDWDGDSERDVRIFGPSPSGQRCVVPNRAPSWSWASVDGFQDQHGATFKVLANTRYKNPKPNVFRATLSSASDEEHSLYSEASTLSPADRYLIKVIGQLIPIEFDTESNEWSHWNMQDSESPAWLKVHVVLDDPDALRESYTSESTSKLYLMPILDYISLVVTSSNCKGVYRKGVYRRVGISDDLTRFMTESSDDEESSGSEEPSDNGEPPDYEAEETSTLGGDDQTSIHTQNEELGDGTGFLDRQDSSGESSSSDISVPWIHTYWTEYSKACGGRLAGLGVLQTIFLA